MPISFPFLLLSTLLLLPTFSNLLRVTVVTTCLRCLYVQHSSITYINSLFHDVHNTLENWTPKSTISITNNYRFEFVSMKSTELREIRKVEGWTVVVGWEGVSLAGQGDVEKELEELAAGQLAKHAVIILLTSNNTGQYSYIKDHSIIAVNQKQFKQNRNGILDEVIKNYTDLRKNNGTSNYKSYPDVLGRIEKMCQSEFRRALLNDYALIIMSDEIHHERLLEHLKGNIREECSESKSSHWLFSVAVVVVGFVVLKDWYVNRKQQPSIV